MVNHPACLTGKPTLGRTSLAIRLPETKLIASEAVSLCPPLMA